MATRKAIEAEKNEKTGRLGANARFIALKNRHAKGPEVGLATLKEYELQRVKQV